MNPTLAPAPAPVAAAPAPVAPVAAAPAPIAMPGIPAPAPQPIEAPDYPTIANKCINMVNSGAMTMETLGGIYAKLGVTDPNVFTTDGALQLALWTELCNIQPEG